MEQRAADSRRAGGIGANDATVAMRGAGGAAACMAVRISGGAQGRDRTTDTVIFSHVLYQLSYLGAETPPNGGACDGGAL